MRARESSANTLQRTSDLHSIDAPQEHKLTTLSTLVRMVAVLLLVTAGESVGESVGESAGYSVGDSGSDSANDSTK